MVTTFFCTFFFFLKLRGINILAVDFRVNEPEKRIVKRLYFDYLLMKTEISLQEHLWMHSTLGRAGGGLRGYGEG